ncbi:MAG: hypothetical protein AVDCRST_MAG33-3401 [uncultured Thermomicrobiales bacterium]|uniref:Response regulatory domain-containing protein n=1 Tax=uncultured Thermomicrobiales bacterium TaxID=1645740 RepID=A0A6J4VKT6_9BACT|nr:MAG: hypothetical protein AVDCRST_MAG33-3401 [uncultured Thermomicrobiales bacterium]
MAVEIENRDRRRRVMVVDDEPAIVELIAMVLEEEDWEIVRAYDGAQAWSLLQARPVDLLLSDIMMPRVNGLELLRLVRTSPRHGSLPVILTSAVNQVDASDIVFLAKPFDLDTLIALVERCLTPARARQD